MSKIQKFQLDNGVRILVEPNETVRSAAVGLWCATGSRHERNSEAGITHLIEHMLFKGTESRSSKEIAETIEGRGGGLNAFTDKESTCYYCRVLGDDVALSVDVLSDMLLHSKIEKSDLELEKGVVLEEISREQDEPSSYVHDLHIENRWGNHPLGKPIIGTPGSVSSFQPKQLKNYLTEHYRAENIMLAVAGAVDPNTVVEQASKLLGGIESGSNTNDVTVPESKIIDSYVEKDIEGVHFCIGTEGLPANHPDSYTMLVIDEALGGNMSSRLFQEIREKRGLAYAIGTYSLRYSVAGTFNVYGGTSPETWHQVKELCLLELDKITKHGIGEAELERIKMGLAGRIILSLESMSSRMTRMSRNEFVYGRQISEQELVDNIRAVDNNQIIELAQQLFVPERISTTAIGPRLPG